jgi:menaquinol-cytochrome c reductase iron-sulfur subunit
MEACTENVAAQNGQGAARRGFLVASIRAIWGFMATALGVPVAEYLSSVSKSESGGEWTEIGEINNLPDGRPVEIVFHRNRADAWERTSEKLTAWVTRTSASSVVAFGPQCTHLGCAHHWDAVKKEFICPCHNSRFSIAGAVLGGPASRPLDRYDVKVEGSRLLIGELIRPEQAQ